LIHRFTLIANALLSGRWSTASGDVGCTWAYTVDERLLRVTRGRVTRLLPFPADQQPISLRGLQDQLPILALSIGNAIEQPA
jgi:hypothetical protein